jgi:integrase
MDNSPLPPIPPATVNRTVRRPNAELRTREHLTAQEVEALIATASANRAGGRDGLMILLAFRHGLRASEVCDLRGSKWTSRPRCCMCAGLRAGQLQRTR